MSNKMSDGICLPKGLVGQKSVEWMAATGGTEIQSRTILWLRCQTMTNVSGFFFELGKKVFLAEHSFCTLLYLWGLVGSIPQLAWINCNLSFSHANQNWVLHTAAGSRTTAAQGGRDNPNSWCQQPSGLLTFPSERFLCYPSARCLLQHSLFSPTGTFYQTA